MVADRLLTHYDFELADAIALSYEVGANHATGTDYNLFAPAFADKLGLRMERTKDINALINCLQTGGAAILLVGGDREGHIGLFTHGGHYMAAIGVEKCIYVGDSEVDVQTARNAGVPCLSVLWGFRDKDCLLSHGADHFCGDPKDLPACLRKIAQE